MYLPDSELLFYGGLALMGAAAVLALACILIFTITGRRIRRRLEEEYGKPDKTRQ